MRFRLLGNSGLRVSELALGTMTFGDDWGWGAAKDEARKVYDAFLRLAEILSTLPMSTPTGRANRFWANSWRATVRALYWPRNTPTVFREQTRTRPATTAGT